MYLGKRLGADVCVKQGTLQKMENTVTGTGIQKQSICEDVVSFFQIM